MKKLLATLLALVLVTSTAQANHDLELWLGEATQIGNQWYIPVRVNNPSLANIRSVTGWGDLVPDLELTGTLAPADPNYHLQGHLNGNYWRYLQGGGLSTIAGQPGKYGLSMVGAWDVPFMSPADCESLPYPHQTSGILCYLHFTGEGTVRFTGNQMFSGHTCFFPFLYYEFYNTGTLPVSFPGPQEPPCYFDCGGDDEPQLPGMVVGAEGAPKEVKASAKRTTWAKIKSYYR